MESAIDVSELNLHYGRFHALKDVNVSIRPRTITAIIGPSGCGKSTLLRCFNRMNDLIDNVRVEGRILLAGQDIHRAGVDLTQLRRKVGMVFQRPNPFPLTVWENIAYGRKVHGLTGEPGLSEAVETSLRGTMLWEELKNKLHSPALELSPEQQQRLCISRLLAIEPDILLMDEPCSALDPIATGHIEELMRRLAAKYTIVIVTHNMQQAGRVSKDTAFMLLGELIEFGPTKEIFTNPRDARTADYVTGRYG